MKIKTIIKDLFLITLPLIGGIIVSLLTNTKSYKIINKPFLSPPSIAFPIAWTVLYLLMGISFSISNKQGKNIQITKVFITQLLINYIWPFLFFSLKLYKLSAVWLLILIIVVIDMIIKFYKNKKVSAYLQLPYFLWLLFALYLNIGVALLN